MKLRFIAVALLVAITAAAAPVDPFLSRSDVRDAITTIRKETAKEHLEVIALVHQDHIDYTTGSGEDCQFMWTPGIIAVFHSHPDNKFYHPSPDDIKLATTMHIPNYVVTSGQLWVVTPDGKVSQVAETGE